MPEPMRPRTSSPPSANSPRVRCSGAGGEDADYWRAERKGLGALVGEAGAPQQGLDLGGGGGGGGGGRCGGGGGGGGAGEGGCGARVERAAGAVGGAARRARARTRAS